MLLEDNYVIAINMRLEVEYQRNRDQLNDSPADQESRA